MNRRANSWFLILVLLLSAFSASRVPAQDSKSKTKDKSTEDVTQNAKLWEPVNIPERDLYNGPGGTEMRPDLSSVTFLEVDTSGHNKKYRIKDAAGREWIVKLGREARPETAAVRILWGIGYKTEINYLAPTITIPGKGTFQNVRLEARPKHIKRLDQWSWSD